MKYNGIQIQCNKYKRVALQCSRNMIFYPFFFQFVNSFHFFFFSFFKGTCLIFTTRGEKIIGSKTREIKWHFSDIISPLEGLHIQANNHPPYSTETLIFQRERASSNIMSEKLIPSRTPWDSWEQKPFWVPYFFDYRK